MLDERHPDDTLFFYAEADFRFWQEHDLPHSDWIPMVLDEIANRSKSDSTGGGSVFSTSLSSSSSSGPVQAPASSNIDHVHPSLVWMVMTATKCWRIGRGHCIWWSWNAAVAGKKPKRPDAPAFGSTLMSFTKRAARHLLDIMEARAAQNRVGYHFDAFIWNELIKMESRTDNLKGCFISPPLGGEAEHHTDIMGGQLRRAWWSEAWALAGGCEIKTKSGDLRSICSITTAGPATKLCEVVGAQYNATFFWRSQEIEYLPDDDPLPSKRAKRDLNALKLKYNKRFFITKDDEVCAFSQSCFELYPADLFSYRLVNKWLYSVNISQQNEHDFQGIRKQP